MSQRVPRLALITALVAGALLAGCKSETPETLLAEAKQFQQKGDKKAAQIQLKNALGKDPDNGEARFMLGKLSLELGEVQAAEKEIRRAIALKYHADEAVPLLAEALLQQGQFQKVLDETEFARRTPAVMAARGNAMIGLQKLDQARKEYQDALQAEPNSAEALTGMARLAALGKDMEGARAFTDQAIAKDAHSVAAWSFKGELLRAQQKPEEAKAAFEEVLKLDPGNRSANLEKAHIDIMAGKYDAAQAAIDAARKASPKNATVMYTQAVLDFSRGKYPAAHDSLMAVLKVAPEHVPSLLLSGAVDFQLGSLKQATASLRKYLDVNPGNIYGRKLLVASLLRQGEPGEALAALTPVLKDKGSDAKLLELAGEANMQLKEYAKAGSYYEQALALDPNSVQLHIALGASHVARNDRSHALAELEKAVALDPKSLQAGGALARTQFDLGELDKAQATLAKVEALHPKEAPVQLLKGRILAAKKDGAGARAAYAKAAELAPASYVVAAHLAQLDLQDKKPDAARQHFLRLLEKDKKNVDAMTALAQLAESAGKRDETYKWLEQAVAENADALQPALRLGAFYLQTGQAPKAVGLMRKMQVANPASSALLEVLGRAQLATGDKTGAVETLSKLASLQPKSAAVQVWLASVNLQLKNESSATASIRKALQLEANYLPAMLMQADMALNARKPDEALQQVRAIQKAHPKSAAGFAAEGDLMLTQGKHAQAVPPLEKAFELARTPALLVKLANSLRAAGKVKEADDKVAAWRKANPDEPISAMYVAETHLGNKQYKPAIALLEGVLKSMPNNVVALNNLAWAYQQDSDKRAVPTAEQALKLAGDNPTVMDTLGFMLVEQGNLERGMLLLKKAAGIAPQAGDIRYHYAVGLSKTGDKAGARKEVQAALAGKQFAQADEARALLKSLE